MRHKIGSTKTVETMQGLLNFMNHSFPGIQFEYESVDNTPWSFEIFASVREKMNRLYIEEVIDNESHTMVLAARAFVCGRGELVY